MTSEEEDSLDWLPDGWITGLQIRTNGKIDRYYTSPISGSTFRSQEEVLRHLTFENDARFPSPALGCNGELSHHNPPLSHTKASEDSPLWLPHGWIMEIKTRMTGTRYKCYVEPSSGHRFYSKPEVFRYLQTGKTGTDEIIVNENPSDHILAQIECSPVGLPPGWIRELRYRRNSSGLRKDPYYKDPTSGYIFRTKKDARRFVETGELGKYVITHSAGKSIIDKYNIDGSPSSIITTVPNQRDVANRRLIISSDPIENVSGLPVECLLLQNVEHEKSNGIEDPERSFVAMLHRNSNTVDSNVQIYQGCQPKPNLETPSDSEHNHKMIRPDSKSDLILSDFGSSRISYPLDKNLMEENNMKSDEGKSPNPMGGIDSSNIAPEKSSDAENGTNKSTCLLRSKQDSEKAMSKSIEPKNIKDTIPEIPTIRTTRSQNFDLLNAASAKSKTQITHLGSNVEKNTRRETRSTSHGSSSVKTTKRKTRGSHRVWPNENTPRYETRSSHLGSSSEVSSRRQTRSSQHGPSTEKITKRTRSGRRGSLSSGTTTSRVPLNNPLGSSSEASTRNNTKSAHRVSSTRSETRSKRGRGSQRNSISGVKRVSKRLAGHDPDFTPDVDLTYRSIRKVRRRSHVAGSENVDGSSIMAIDNVIEEGVLPVAEAAIDLPVEYPLEISSPFGDAWPDPCIEFAFKTLTGDIPNFEDSAVVQYFKQQLTSTVSNPTTITTTSSPAPQDFVKIEFDANPESRNHYDLEQVKINQEFCTASKDEIIPPPQSFSGETKHD